MQKSLCWMICLLLVGSMMMSNSLQASEYDLNDQLAIRINGIYGRAEYQMPYQIHPVYPSGTMVEIERGWSIVPGVRLILAPAFLTINKDYVLSGGDPAPFMWEVWKVRTSINIVYTSVKYALGIDLAEGVNIEFQNGFGLGYGIVSEEWVFKSSGYLNPEPANPGSIKTGFVVPALDFGLNLRVRVSEVSSLGLNYSYFPSWISFGHYVGGSFSRAGVFYQANY